MKKIAHFLSADRPLTKEYYADGTSSSYPNAFEFTSHEVQVPDLRSLVPHLQAQSHSGHCLLKGVLKRPLVRESRAGSTDPTSLTWWLCFDLDGAPYATPADFMRERGLQDVSYILQWSASHGLSKSPGLRCHIIIELSKARSPDLLKRWLRHQNFSSAALQGALRLTASQTALRYALDVTTCQSDKLIFTAPPKLAAGMVDPVSGPRIAWVQGKVDTLDVDPPSVPSNESLQEMTERKINELRKTAGAEPRKKFNTKVVPGTGTEYMPNPSQAEVTGIKKERGKVYLNLNGGDSWGYWHHEKNPDYIYNFKGEPVYKTSELLPSYWRTLRIFDPAAQAGKEGEIIFGFRDQDTSKYNSCTYDPHARTVQIYKVDSETQLRQYLTERGRVLGDVVPTWRVMYDPLGTTVVDDKSQEINIYEAPNHPVPADPNFPTIHRVISHALGGDPAVVGHFYNWLAFIVNNCQAPGTAWLLQGVEGTGKGLLSQVLSWTLGQSNVVQRNMSELESQFTGWLGHRQIVVIDEMESKAIAYNSKIMASLKTLITEPYVAIRKMYAATYEVMNYAGWIFLSNRPNPVELHPGDRRFNVGDFQRLVLEWDKLMDYAKLQAEVPAFYHALRKIKPNEQMTRTVLDTPARRTLIDRNQSTADKLAQALRKGDIAFLWDQLPQDLTPGIPANEQLKNLEKMRELMFQVVKERRTKLTRDDLHTIFIACTDNVPRTPTKFSNFLGFHDIVMGRVRMGERTVAGIQVHWQWAQEWLAEADAAIAAAERRPALAIAHPLKGA